MAATGLVASLDHPALKGVETALVGSAKVPLLPCLQEVTEAASVEALAVTLAREAPRLEAYAAVLEAEGLGDMAGTLRRVVARTARLTRMNADLAAVLTWVLNAQHKTAGRATMKFAPWATASDRGSAPRMRLSRGSSPYVVLPEVLVDAMASANGWVYERLIGRLNAAADASGPHAEVAAIVHAAAEGRRAGLEPRFIRPQHVKSLLKVDYKLDRLGHPVIVDINAGLVGAWFDDLLFHDIAEFADVRARITPRLVKAVLDRYRLECGDWPRRVVLCVLDEEMYRQWRTADIAGLIDEVGRQLLHAGRGKPSLAVIDARGLRSVALGEKPSELYAGTWTGMPDLAVLYSCRVAPAMERSLLEALEQAGVTLVDGAVHGSAATKDLATVEVLGEGLPGGVRLPETLALGAVGDGAAAAAAVERAWNVATTRGWGLLAVKIDKQRREGGSGDFPTAHLYPVTAVGKVLAARQVERTFDGITAASGRAMRLVVTRVDHLGGCAGPCGRLDVEIRTYAFPVLAD